MCKIKLTLDTKDRDALEAVSDLCLTLANRISDPARDNVVELYEDARVRPEHASVAPPPKTYDVDGRQYTAEGIRAGGFTAVQLFEAGLLANQIAEILKEPVDSIVSLVREKIEPARLSETPEPEPVPEPEPRTTGVELDAGNPPLPWDARIHSGSKSKVADGTWRRKKGVDKAIVEEVEAELIALMSAGAQDVTFEGQPTPYDDQIAPPPQAGQTNVVPPPPVAEPETPDAGAMTFPQFLKACSLKINGGDGVTMDQILSVLNRHGVASLQLVRNREGLIPQIWADIDAGLFDE